VAGRISLDATGSIELPSPSSEGQLAARMYPGEPYRVPYPRPLSLRRTSAANPRCLQIRFHVANVGERVPASSSRYSRAIKSYPFAGPSSNVAPPASISPSK
jgi:hypothetical protein